MSQSLFGVVVRKGLIAGHDLLWGLFDAGDALVGLLHGGGLGVLFSRCREQFGPLFWGYKLYSLQVITTEPRPIVEVVLDEAIG